jgi:hypothetical protein
MAPTLIQLLTTNTVIRRSDLVFVSQTMRDAVSEHGSRYIDLLEHEGLEQQMIHYDNLTAQGQKLLAGVLNDQIGATLRRAGPQTSEVAAP